MRLRWESAIVWIGACVAVFATARLGLWQLDRASHQTTLAHEQAQRSEQPMLTTPQLARSAAEASMQWHRRVALSGRWLHRQTLFLDNRPLDGRAGLVVLTPLLIAPGDAVLVQRGWVQRDPLDRARLPQLPRSDDEVALIATIAPVPSRRLELQGADDGPIRQNLDLAALAREIGVEFRPLSLLETQAPVPDDGLVRRWSVPAQAVWKHHGYAFQWFALSALIAGLTVWFRIVRPLRARRS
jgi:surfeit locus 1 family protein